MVIEVGDGTWQKRLDANQCPKCRHKLEFFATKKLRLLVCPLCKLEIIQRHPKEAAMMETKLMPSEEDLCSVPEKMYWSDAVTVIEDVIENWLDDADVSNEAEAKVREAWKRILQG